MYELGKKFTSISNSTRYLWTRESFHTTLLHFKRDMYGTWKCLHKSSYNKCNYFWPARLVLYTVSDIISDYVSEVGTKFNFCKLMQLSVIFWWLIYLVLFLLFVQSINLHATTNRWPTHLMIWLGHVFTVLHIKIWILYNWYFLQAFNFAIFALLLIAPK